MGEYADTSVVRLQSAGVEFSFYYEPDSVTVGLAARKVGSTSWTYGPVCPVGDEFIQGQGQGNAETFMRGFFFTRMQPFVTEQLGSGTVAPQGPMGTLEAQFLALMRRLAIVDGVLKLV